MLASKTLAEPRLEPLTRAQARFNRIVNGYTFHHKDAMGLYLWMLLLVFAGLAVLGCGWCIVPGFAFVALIYKKPINALYMGSVLFTLSLRTPEFMDRYAHFPQHATFETPSTFAAIRDEVVQYVNTHQLKRTADTYGGENGKIGAGDNVSTGAAWRLKPVMTLGSFAADAKALMPTLVEAIRRVGPSVTYCVISVVEPGVHIPMHTGYFKGALRYMLAIEVPTPAKGVWLNVNGHKYNWTEGTGVLFDDTYPHAVYNTTTGRRIVLLTDVVRTRNIPRALQRISSALLHIAKWSGIVDVEVKSTETPLKISSTGSGLV